MYRTLDFFFFTNTKQTLKECSVLVDCTNKNLCMELRLLYLICDTTQCSFDSNWWVYSLKNNY
jgi:hypothetical protein